MNKLRFGHSIQQKKLVKDKSKQRKTEKITIIIIILKVKQKYRFQKLLPEILSSDSSSSSLSSL